VLGLRQVGFRVGPGLRDRVIYRELFPFGLTVADLSLGMRPVAMSLQHVAARQELRALMGSVGLTEGRYAPQLGDDEDGHAGQHDAGDGGDGMQAAGECFPGGRENRGTEVVG